ncbi:glycosyltransferase family A protein [Aeromonas caviae]|uniref:glycosyltransferase family A protein n=1 Tax=Aeromonas caviae TaxID=648 RepID=UPI002B4A5585|nr:glycosyltransferase family A protein [Aeromonas caviae]
MQNKDTLAIVIPVYNVEKYICSALNSVLNQTIKPEQIIIVDDGSTDKSAQLIEPIVRDAENITFVKKNNGGLSSARNYGFSFVNTEYVYFFDSDDILKDDFVADFKDVLSRHRNIDLYSFSGESFYDAPDVNAPKLPSYKRMIDGCYLDADDYFYNLLETNSYFSSICLNVFRTNVLRDNQLCFKNIIHEDEEFLPQAIFLSKGFYINKDVYFLRRIRGASIMTSPKSEKNIIGYLETLSVYLKIINLLSKNKISLSADLLQNRFDEYVVYINKIVIDNKLKLSESSENDLSLYERHQLKGRYKTVLIKRAPRLYKMLFKIKNILMRIK